MAVLSESNICTKGEIFFWDSAAKNLPYWVVSCWMRHRVRDEGLIRVIIIIIVTLLIWSVTQSGRCDLHETFDCFFGRVGKAREENRHVSKCQNAVPGGPSSDLVSASFWQATLSVRFYRNSTTFLILNSQCACSITTKSVGLNIHHLLCSATLYT